jgi:hypothetical protein
MFAVHRCTGCSASLRRSQCTAQEDGLYGPEVLCPHCGALVRARLTVLGWVVTLSAATALGLAVIWLQSDA